MHATPIRTAQQCRRSVADHQGCPPDRPWTEARCEPCLHHVAAGRLQRFRDGVRFDALGHDLHKGTWVAKPATIQGCKTMQCVASRQTAAPLWPKLHESYRRPRKAF